MREKEKEKKRKLLRPRPGELEKIPYRETALIEGVVIKAFCPECYIKLRMTTPNVCHRCGYVRLT